MQGLVFNADAYFVRRPRSLMSLHVVAGVNAFPVMVRKWFSFNHRVILAIPMPDITRLVMGCSMKARKCSFRFLLYWCQVSKLWVVFVSVFSLLIMPPWCDTFCTHLSKVNCQLVYGSHDHQTKMNRTISFARSGTENLWLLPLMATNHPKCHGLIELTSYWQ